MLLQRFYRKHLKTLCFLLSCFISVITAHAQLKADFTPDKTGGCSPFTVSFNNTTTAASAAATYKWDFGNGNTSTLKSAGATYKDEKSYTVTLTVKDGSQTSTKTHTITDYKKPVIDFTASPIKRRSPLPLTFNSASPARDGSIS